MIKLSDYGYQVLQIETYGLCNMECGFCPYPSKSKNAKTSKLEDGLIKKIIDEIDPNDEKFKYNLIKLMNKVVTKISLLNNYCIAEEYHQKYLEKR